MQTRSEVPHVAHEEQDSNQSTRSASIQKLLNIWSRRHFFGADVTTQTESYTKLLQDTQNADAPRTCGKVPAHAISCTTACNPGEDESVTKRRTHDNVILVHAFKTVIGIALRIRLSSGTHSKSVSSPCRLPCSRKSHGSNSCKTGMVTPCCAEQKLCGMTCAALQKKISPWCMHACNRFRQQVSWYSPDTSIKNPTRWYHGRSSVQAQDAHQ